MRSIWKPVVQTTGATHSAVKWGDTKLMSEVLTHDDLVFRATRWLRNTQRCGVVVPELVSYANENPDVVGWRKQGMESILVECKASRRDFLADKKKAVRQTAHRGMGDLRYYFTGVGVVRTDELPERWGLAEVHGRRIHVIKQAERVKYDHRQGQIMMYSLLRRAECKGLLRQCLSAKWGGDDDFNSGTRPYAETA